MIVILSYEEYEQGTEPVIDWLVYKKADFVKITLRDLYCNNLNLAVDPVEGKVWLDGNDITSRINVIFYRRFLDSVQMPLGAGGLFRDQLKGEMTDEIADLTYHLFNILKNKKWLPAPSVVNVNKLNIIRRAHQAGLKVPGTRVLNNRKDLLQFMEAAKNGVITKPIRKSNYYITGKHTHFAHVNAITREWAESVPEQFFPSLFQEKIEKEYEVRVFYLDGRFYNVAMIHTGADPQVDIKVAHNNKNGHWVPYLLPREVEKRIDFFMKSLGLNTGSLDVIKGADDYYFLEVNPVGQYGAPSRFGNFDLDRLIAEWLLQNDTCHE